MFCYAYKLNYKKRLGATTTRRFSIFFSQCLFLWLCKLLQSHYLWTLSGKTSLKGIHNAPHLSVGGARQMMRTSDTNWSYHSRCHVRWDFTKACQHSSSTETCLSQQLDEMHCDLLMSDRLAFMYCSSIATRDTTQIYGISYGPSLKRRRCRCHSKC